jgi:hypothetical protein
VTVPLFEKSSTRRPALGWIDQYADLQRKRLRLVQRRNEETGLENQCWKDSWDSISYREGYAYDAKVRGARLARLVWNDNSFADRSTARLDALATLHGLLDTFAFGFNVVTPTATSRPAHWMVYGAAALGADPDR